MRIQVKDWLLLASTFTLFMGLSLKFVFSANVPASFVWAIGGLLGLIPAIKWVLDDLKDRQIGSDVLAILSILGATFTNEFFAASVISFMLATGRSLESWAEGRAEFALKSLIDQIGRAHV